MNLLLVDDEKLVIDGLLEGVNWGDVEIDAVFSALCAADAKRVVLENNIDIVICDIEMPEENGIAFLEWLHEVRPDVIAVILTGHENFSYAQQAVHLNVAEYLLKPVPFPYLESAIRTCVKKALKHHLSEAGERPVHPVVAEALSGQKLLISKIMEYIDEHIVSNINRLELCDVFHMHPDSLSKFFKKMTGMSIPEYISEVRIEKSKQYLLNTELTISEISLQVGFSNFSYFNLIFKKATGFTPTAYRHKYISTQLF